MAHHTAPHAPAHHVEVVTPDAAHALAAWWHARGHAGPAPAVVPGRTLVLAARPSRSGSWTAALALRFVGDHAVVGPVVGEPRTVAVLAARVASHLAYRGTPTVDAAGAPSAVSTALRAAGIAVVDACATAA
jgi:hypothetical protein